MHWGRASVGRGIARHLLGRSRLGTRAYQDASHLTPEQQQQLQADGSLGLGQGQGRGRGRGGPFSPQYGTAVAPGQPATEPFGGGAGGIGQPATRLHLDGSRSDPRVGQWNGSGNSAGIARVEPGWNGDPTAWRNGATTVERNSGAGAGQVDLSKQPGPYLQDPRSQVPSGQWREQQNVQQDGGRGLPHQGEGIGLPASAGNPPPSMGNMNREMGNFSGVPGGIVPQRGMIDGSRHPQVSYYPQHAQNQGQPRSPAPTNWNQSAEQHTGQQGSAFSRSVSSPPPAAATVFGYPQGSVQPQQGGQPFQTLGTSQVPGFPSMQGAVHSEGLQGLGPSQSPRGFGQAQGFGPSQGLQGFGPSQSPQGFVSSQGLQGFGPSQDPQVFGSSQGLQGFGPSQGPEGFGSSQGLQGFGPSQGPQGFGSSQGLQGFGPSQGPQGFGSSQGLQGFGPSPGPQGFGPSPGPQGFGSSQGLQGFGSSQGPQGFGSSQVLQGFASSQGPQGSEPSQSPQGFRSSQVAEGLGPSQSSQNFAPAQVFQGFGPSQGHLGFGPTQNHQGLGYFQSPQGFPAQGIGPTHVSQGFAPSQVPQGFGPTQVSQGFGPSQVAQGFGPSQVHQSYGPPHGLQGFGPSQGAQVFGPSQVNPSFLPPQFTPGFGLSQGYQGFVPSQIPHGYGLSQVPQGFGPSQGQGFMPSQHPQGFLSSQVPPGFVPSQVQGQVYAHSQGLGYGPVQGLGFGPLQGQGLGSPQGQGFTYAQVQGQFHPHFSQVAQQQQPWNVSNSSLSRNPESNVPSYFKQAAPQTEQSYTGDHVTWPSSQHQTSGMLPQERHSSQVPLSPGSMGSASAVSGKGWPMGDAQHPEDYASLIASSFRQGRQNEVEVLFEEMKGAKVPVQIATYNVLMEMYSRTGQLDKLDQIYKDMRQAAAGFGQSRVEPLVSRSSHPSATPPSAPSDQLSSSLHGPQDVSTRTQGPQSFSSFDGSHGLSPKATVAISGPLFSDSVKPSETRTLSPQSSMPLDWPSRASMPVQSRPLELKSQPTVNKSVFPLPGVGPSQSRPSETHWTPQVSIGRPLSPLPIVKPFVPKPQTTVTETPRVSTPAPSAAVSVNLLPVIEPVDTRHQFSSPREMSPTPVTVRPGQSLPFVKSAEQSVESLKPMDFRLKESARMPIPPLFDGKPLSQPDAPGTSEPSPKKFEGMPVPRFSEFKPADAQPQPSEKPKTFVASSKSADGMALETPTAVGPKAVEGSVSSVSAQAVPAQEPNLTTSDAVKSAERNPPFQFPGLSVSLRSGSGRGQQIAQSVSADKSIGMSGGQVLPDLSSSDIPGFGRGQGATVQPGVVAVDQFVPLFPGLSVSLRSGSGRGQQIAQSVSADKSLGMSGGQVLPDLSSSDIPGFGRGQGATVQPGVVAVDQFVPLSLFGQRPEVRPGLGRGRGKPAETTTGVTQFSPRSQMPVSQEEPGVVWPGLGRGRGNLTETTTGVPQFSPRSQRPVSQEEPGLHRLPMPAGAPPVDPQFLRGSQVPIAVESPPVGPQFLRTSQASVAAQDSPVAQPKRATPAPRMQRSPEASRRPATPVPRLQLSPEEASRRAQAILLESAERDRGFEREDSERRKQSLMNKPTDDPMKDAAVERAMGILEQNLRISVHEEAEKRSKGKLDKFSEFTNVAQRRRAVPQIASSNQSTSSRPRADRRDKSLSQDIVQPTAEMELQDAEDAEKSTLHQKFRMDFDPQYAMEDFGKNPDIEEKPLPTLEEALQEAKHLLMPLEGIVEEYDWQANVKKMLDRAPHLDKLVEAYNGPARITTREQNEQLEMVAGKLPPHASPELTAFTQRALLTLQNNPSWRFAQKEQMMKNVVSGFSNY